MRKALVLPAIAVIALLAGCGGGGSGEPGATATATTPSADDAVRTAATRLLETDDTAVLCGELVTRRFITEVYKGDEARCVSAQREALEEDEAMGRGEVTGTEVTGARAVVATRTVGGKAPGTTGHLAFVREGDAWKLDRYEDDYLRNALIASMEVAGQEDGTNMYTEPSLRRCIIADTKAMAPAELRRYMYLFLRRDRKRARAKANAQAAGCPDELAVYVTNVIVKALNEDGKRSAAYVRCARNQLQFLLQATGLAKEGLRGNVSDASTAAFQGLAIGVNKTCTAQERRR